MSAAAPPIPAGAMPPPEAVAGAGAGAGPGAEYTCPMHREIRQAQPGSCPKCGMTLEPVLPELQETSLL